MVSSHTLLQLGFLLPFDLPYVAGSQVSTKIGIEFKFWVTKAIRMEEWSITPSGITVTQVKDISWS
jgi:hypothetical protein